MVDVQRLEGELKEAEKALPADFRDAYQRIVKSKGSDAMAPSRAKTAAVATRTSRPICSARC